MCCQVWNKTFDPCTHSMFNFHTHRALFSTLNITTSVCLCTCSRPFYVCVFIVPHWHGEQAVCVYACVCVLPACFLFVCRWGWGGGGWGFGHRGNKPVPGRKTASLLPPLFFLSLRPHPQQPPSVFMSLIHLLCDDAPPAAGGCIPTKHMTAVVHQGGRHLFIEKMLWVKRCSIIAPFPILFIISFEFVRVLSCCVLDVRWVHARFLERACSVPFSLIYTYL